MTAKTIKEHLKRAYSFLSELFDKTPDVELLQSNTDNIPEALVKIVVNQMLSRKAADTIYERVEKIAKENNSNAWELEFEQYRSCGLSKTKANTIIEFSNFYNNNTKAVLNWPTLSTEEIIKQITSIKGLGLWSANIMAMFYLGKGDVFPNNDATLNKVKQLLEEKYKTTIDIELASPYKTYLAQYFWRFEDNGLV